MDILKNKRKDIIVIAVILGLIFCSFGINYLFFQDKGEVYCEIYVDGDLVKTVDLMKDTQFSIAERPDIVFEVKNHAIAFVESDCPDKVCVHAGYLGHTGQNASCLPNKTTIRICSNHQDADDPEIVVGWNATLASDGSRYEK